MYLIPQEGARKGMWTQLVTVDREQGDARGWGLCSLRPRGHRIKKKKNQNQPNAFLASQNQAQGWLLTQTELGKTMGII